MIKALITLVSTNYCKRDDEEKLVLIHVVQTKCDQLTAIARSAQPVGCNNLPAKTKINDENLSCKSVVA